MAQDSIAWHRMASHCTGSPHAMACLGIIMWRGVAWHSKYGLDSSEGDGMVCAVSREYDDVRVSVRL